MANRLLHNMKCLGLMAALLTYMLVMISFSASSANGNIFESIRSKAVHLASQGRDSGWYEIKSLSHRMSEAEDTFLKESLHRHRRSEDDSLVDPQNRVTVAQLHDNHSTLIVHWAGAGSDAIFALAKNSAETSSALFISRDYGKSFTDVMSRLRVGSDNETAVIHQYYNLNESNSVYVFTDIKHRCIFTTSNMGDTFTSHCQLPFTPRTLKLNPKNTRFILGSDEESYMANLYVSEDFGANWRFLTSHVKSFHWGVHPHDFFKWVYVEKVTEGEKGEVLKFVVGEDKPPEVLISDVTNFEIRDEYMFAVRSVHLLGIIGKHDPELQLWVSYNRGSFYMAQFPMNYSATDFYVADASEGQVMVCVSHNSTLTNLYISEVRGYKFSLSLEKIVFFNPKADNFFNWLRFYTNKTFADITKIGGVNGIYIASQQLGNLMGVEEQRSLITFDKGGQWQPIPPPQDVLGKKPSDCDQPLSRNMTENLKLNNCSLHLTQEFHNLYPSTQATSILSQESAPGLVVASGVLGKTLKADTDVFVSTDAGISWRQVLIGNYFYAIGDHGGIIVAIRKFEPTNEIIYSINEGGTWKQYKFYSEKIRVYGVLTEPGEKTTIFSIFGSHTSAHSWLVIQIDFKNEFNNKVCTSQDYKMWSVSEAMPDKDFCLLGHVTEFQRRIANVVCYNGIDFIRRVEKKNCSCTREDFECDFGYKESSFGEACQPDEQFGSKSLNTVPAECKPGDFYEHTRGYRKVAGDTCQGGDEHKYIPLLYSCPIPERPEFIVFIRNSQINLLDLASEEMITLLQWTNLEPYLAFDYKENCLIYVVNRNVLRRRCFTDSDFTNTIREEIHTHEHDAPVTGMAFEWTGRLFYLAFADRNEIQVLSASWTLQRTIYKEGQGVYSPRNLIVDPHHGYLFFVGQTKKGGNDYAIFRAVMDGSDTTVSMVANSSVVSSVTRMTLDLQMERLYWFSNAQFFVSDFWGQKVTLLSSIDSSNRLISGIGIYKNDLYVSSRSASNIYRANKNELDRWELTIPYSNFVDGMTLVSNISQHATSACSSFHTTCSQLCLPRPTPNPDSSTDHQNRTCLCGDGYLRTVVGDGTGPRDETCHCEEQEVMTENGTCIVAQNATSCGPDKITCRNGRCVLAMWKCDGDDDCGDGTDEMDCSYMTCGDDSFTCRNGRCIPLHWQCDREDDCRDGYATDELNCGKKNCSEDEFRCDNGYCINKRWRCDMDDDCHDNSDEKGCYNNTECHEWAFHCNDGFCIDSYKHCNGHRDCIDGSDENNCPTSPISNCSTSQFSCASGNQCILVFWQCDGAKDCDDGSDELNCGGITNFTPPPPTTPNPWRCDFRFFRCDNGFCIPSEEVCNFVDDCGDGSDELRCMTPPVSTLPPYTTTRACRWNERQCRTGGQCVEGAKFCDGRADCRDGSDEDSCSNPCQNNEFYCFNSSGQCIPLAWKCDGDNDCRNHEDEAFCSSVTAPADEVSCLDNSGNIPRSSLCDTKVDCRDGSDELNCDYSGRTVNCSNFNNHQEVCCNVAQCQHFVISSSWWTYRNAGTCYPKSSTYGTNKCPANSVEYSCDADSFKCGDVKKTCLASVQICNNRVDCSNGKDEENCQDCNFSTRSHFYYPEITNKSVSWSKPAEVNTLAYAQIEDSKPLSKLAFRYLNVTTNPMIVRGLLPGRPYQFSFLKDHCVLNTLIITTRDGVSSAPNNLKVEAERYDDVTYGVSVMWTEPENPNGKIQSFMVYHQKVSTDGKTLSDVLSDGFGVDIVRSNGIDYKAIVTNDIVEGAIYEFWVAAVNRYGVGATSKKIQVTITDNSQDLKVTVRTVTETSVTVTWKGDQNATGYRVSLFLPQYQNQDLNVDVDKGVKSYTFSDLCPGITVHAGVRAKYHSSNNPHGKIWYANTTQDDGSINLKGQVTLVDIVSVNMTGSTSAIVYYKTKPESPSAKQYIISYSTSEYQGQLVKPTRVTSLNQSSFEVSGLLACEVYFLGVSAGYASCPMSQTATILTDADLMAAPKHVVAQKPEIHNDHYRVNLTWEAPCAHMPVKLRYAIRVQVDNKLLTEILTPNETLSIDNFYVFDKVLSDVTYSFSVRSNVKGAQQSKTVSVRIPKMNGPEVYIIPSSGDNLTVGWIWQYKDQAEDFKEYILTTTDTEHTFTWKNHTSDRQIVLNGLPTNKDLLFHLEAVSKSETVIAESETMQYAFYPEINMGPHSPDKDSISKTNLVAILVPVSLVVIILAAGLVVFIVRHKRLQRSFLAFANSHYNIQSGTTTFSDDLDGDEPMIQGFSDDEPLVLA